jgi:hypothetical protein
MSKNMVEPERPQMTTGHMRFACRIPKATHSQYLILIAFPRNNGYANAPHCYVSRTLSVLIASVLTALRERSQVSVRDHTLLRSALFSLTPRSRVPLDNLTIPQLVTKLRTFYTIRGSITALTKARYPSLSWAKSIDTTPSHPISLRFALILFSHLRPCLISCLFPSDFPTKIMCT